MAYGSFDLWPEFIRIGFLPHAMESKRLRSIPEMRQWPPGYRLATRKVIAVSAASFPAALQSLCSTSHLNRLTTAVVKYSLPITSPSTDYSTKVILSLTPSILPVQLNKLLTTLQALAPTKNLPNTSVLVATNLTHHFSDTNKRVLFSKAVVVLLFALTLWR